MSEGRRGRWLDVVSVGLILTGLGLWVWHSRRAAVPLPGPVKSSMTAAELAKPLSSDPAVIVKTLPNGLRYYIRPNRQPRDRAELRLVVNAGSVLEEDDQLGLAHFVEHMAFNGTKHFPKQDIASFMQSIGMRFGPSVNAVTSFDETVYALQVPTDKLEILDRAFLILSDWAQSVTFDPVEIDKERGVVIEEWRLRRSAAARLQDAQFPVLLKGSRYADRIPIGTTENLRTFKPERLKQFYADWYRPDLMALVAVGDFQTSAVDGLVQKHFAGMRPAQSPKPRPTFDVPAQPGTIYAIDTDKEVTGASVSVYAKTKPRPQVTVADYRRELADRLAASLLSARLSDIAQLPNAPFLAAAANRARIVRPMDVTVLTASLKPEAIEAGLGALFLEAERVSRFGFTSEEFERQKSSTLRGFEQNLAEQENRPSAALAAEYGRHFTINEAFPGLTVEADLTRRFLPEIAIAEVNALAKAWAPDRNRVVLLRAPDRPNVIVPDQAKVAALMAAAGSASLGPPLARIAAQPLLDAAPVPGTVETSTAEPMGITEWRLSNGARVLLKPTSFKEDEILVSAFSPGGTSLASDEDFIPALTAAQVVSAMGVGKFASGDLKRMLASKVVSVQPSIGLLQQGLGGGSSRADLETLFQLMYLHFREPRRDPGIFAAMISQIKAATANQAASPDFAFASTLVQALTQNHLRAQPLTNTTVDQMNLDKSLAFYKDRFADASNFTFVFVGSFDPAMLKPLVEKYVASLPSLHRKEQWRDSGIRAPRGIVERHVEKGTEPKGRTSIVFTGPFEDSPSHSLALKAMSDILESRLRETLREELGGTYSVTVSPNASKIPIGEYNVSINFGSDPARIDALVTRVFSVISRFKTDGPTAKEVTDARTALLRDFETNSRSNAYLLGQIVQRLQLGDSLDTLLQLPTLIGQLAAGSIRDAARSYLDTNNYVKVTLAPAK